MSQQTESPVSIALSVDKHNNLVMGPPRCGVLMPGLQAAIDLLEREIINETAASDLADGADKVSDALAHGRNVRAFRLAQALLREQMARLAGPTAEIEP